MIRNIGEQEFWKLLDDNSHRSVCWDIETAPETESVLRRFYDESKLDLPPNPGSWDRKQVKLGNLKDQIKIQEKISEAREKHNLALADWVTACETKRRSAWEAFIDRAPLSAVYGKICAIGYGVTDGMDLAVWLDITEDENLLLIHFWRVVANLRRRGNDALLVAHNGDGFDCPFVTRRSWRYDLRPPKVPKLFEKDKWTPAWIVDTLKVWACGDYREYIKLDLLAKMLGVDGKLEGVTGDMFWKLLRDGELETARKYLRSDITALYWVSKKLGVI